MFSLVYHSVGENGRLVRREENFLPTEQRLAVEIARIYQDNPKIQNVVLYDFRLEKAEIVSVYPALFAHEGAIEKERKILKVPSFKRIDLSKLPRPRKIKSQPAKVVKVVTEKVFTPRKTKQERKFATV